MTTAEVVARLAARHGAPEWAFFEQVASATGGRSTRTADGLAMNLWPSRGLEVHGFEVKVSRSDWLRELKAPEKADEIAGYCDRWWLVLGDAKIVQPGEVPATWGILGPRGDGLVVVKEAAKLEPRPLDRAFVAAILRKASAGVVPLSAVRARIEDAERHAEERHAEIHKRDEERIRALEQDIETFEQRSGVRISRWEAGDAGDAVRALLRGDAVRLLRDMECVRGHTARVLEQMDEHIAKVREAIPQRTGEAA